MVESNVHDVTEVSPVYIGLVRGLVAFWSHLCHPTNQSGISKNASNLLIQAL